VVNRVVIPFWPAANRRCGKLDDWACVSASHLRRGPCEPFREMVSSPCKHGLLGLLREGEGRRTQEGRFFGASDLSDSVLLRGRRRRGLRRPSGRPLHRDRFRGLLSREGVVGRALRITLLGSSSGSVPSPSPGRASEENQPSSGDYPPYRISWVFKERSEFFSVDHPYSSVILTGCITGLTI
jgi:hypothetical protein